MAGGGKGSAQQKTVRQASVLSQDSAPCNSDSVDALLSSPWIPFYFLCVQHKLAFTSNTQYLHGQQTKRREGTLCTCASR